MRRSSAGNPKPLIPRRTMFEKLETAPADPILGLSVAFKEDPNPNKINLGVGVYQDSTGKTPVLESVRQAENRLSQTEQTKSYLPIDGSPGYGQAVRKLMFGADHEVLSSGRAITAQTPGGTGGLRVAADFIRQQFPQATLWLSQPTWANHPAIFAAAGVPTKNYAYYDPQAFGLDIAAMLDDLQKIPAGDVVLLHGCCHNPSGIDPSPEQWKKIGDVIAERGLLPLVDFAYQGFGDGLREDAAGLLEIGRPGGEMLVVSSFSKNFSLYRERVGAMTLVAADAASAGAAFSHVKRSIRTNYSNPPAHGASVVEVILGDQQLKEQWLGELSQMRNRINGMRKLFVETMKQAAPGRDFSFLLHQRGMFSFSGLTAEQVDALRETHSIYMVRSGRINVAGMTESNMDGLCQAIASVL